VSQTSRGGSLKGAARPRVEVHPPYEYTLGPEARGFAERAGLILDQWQADAIDLILAVRADGKWACFECAELVARQNGKGAILEVRALAGLFLLGEQLIMWSAHEYKTAMEGFRRVKSLLARLGTRLSDTLYEVDGIRIKINNTNGEEGLERLDTEARLRFIARSKGSGRGFSGDCNIIDEAFAYTQDQQEALMPTMSARENPQTIYTSSPPLDGASGEVMFALQARAEAGGDDSLGYRDWGCAGELEKLDQVDLDDRALWAASNPTLGSRISIEAIIRERRSMGDRGFARERLGIWPTVTKGNMVIDPAIWARLADVDSRRIGPIALGVDLSELRDYAAVCVYGVREDGLGHVQLADYRPGTKWVCDRLKELRDALEPLTIAMGRATWKFLETDLTKAGFAPPEDPDEPKAGDLAVTNVVDMAAATGQILVAVRDQSFRYVPARHLDLAVAGAKTKASGDTIVWTVRGAEVETSPLVAMTVARWAYDSRAHLVAASKYNLAESVF
jgi:hypothetical protein